MNIQDRLKQINKEINRKVNPTDGDMLRKYCFTDQGNEIRSKFNFENGHSKQEKAFYMPREDVFYAVENYNYWLCQSGNNGLAIGKDYEGSFNPTFQSLMQDRRKKDQDNDPFDYWLIDTNGNPLTKEELCG